VFVGRVSLVALVEPMMLSLAHSVPLLRDLPEQQIALLPDSVLKP
jgi:hypothetical protein